MKDKLFRRRRQTVSRCHAGTGIGRQDCDDNLNRLTRINRQLDIAVAEENYSLAAQLRDESKIIFDSIPTAQQYIFHQLKTLRTATSLEERVKAVAGLGDTGDESALPYLSALLSDEQLHSSAQSAMWAIFMSCKDPVAQDALMEGTRLMANDQFQQARQLFEQVIRKCPTFAEGYNKRATLSYAQRRFQESIADCQKVLSIQPYHFGAASGMGLCHLKLGEVEQAMHAFELALAINPGLPDIARIAASLRKSLSQVEDQGQDKTTATGEADM